jgi:hypothetical protein
MPHQAQVVEAAAEGHRTFLLADEPGLGKTAQALLAAQAADAYPLLVVVPNVVKTNWAREAGIWTPSHPATVVHGDGDDVDAFSDIVIVNYDILDRHVGWLGTLGFRGMVVDEAHFIKNKSSQRSRHVLELSAKIRSRTLRPLLMALTGTPLINDIEDFLAIWEFLGWIGDKEPGPALMEALEDNGLTPADPGFLPLASPPTSPPAGSPTCPSSSTEPSAGRSARPSGSWPAGWSSATRAPSPPATPGSWWRASTTTWSARSRAGSWPTARTRRRRTSSR